MHPSKCKLTFLKSKIPHTPHIILKKLTKCSLTKYNEIKLLCSYSTKQIKLLLYLYTRE